MRILPYYVLHTVVNSIKKLFKTWVAILLAVIVGFGLIGGIIGYTVGTLVEDSADTSYEEVIEEEENFSAQDLKEMRSFFRGIILLIGLATVLCSIYSGDKSGTKIFTMPDVNFLFAAPIAPQSVLMFRTILQIGVVFLSSIYLLFQIPNLMNAGISLAGCISIFIAVILLLYLSRLSGVFTYTITATNEKLRKYIRPFVIIAVLLIVLLFLGYSKQTDIGYFKSFLQLFSSEKIEYIPIFGWLSGMILSAQRGEMLSFVIYFLLIVAVFALLTSLIWRIRADFYEDALTGASEVQEQLNAAKSGETIKRKKERSKKIRRNEEFKGEGAFVFFTKTLYNRRRFAKFGIFSPTAFTYFAIALASTLGVKLLFKTETVLPLGFILFTCVFFRNLGNPLADELSRDYIFTVPESPVKKLSFSLLGCVAETVLDLVPAIIIAAIAIPSRIFEIVIWSALWVSLDIFCSAVGLFIELLFPTSINPSIKAMFGIFIRMFAIVPALIFAIVSAALKLPALLTAAIFINLIFGGIFAFISPVFLHSGRK